MSCLKGQFPSLLFHFATPHTTQKCHSTEISIMELLKLTFTFSLILLKVFLCQYK